MEILKKIYNLIWMVMFLPANATAAIIDNPNGAPPDNANEIANLISRVQQMLLGAAGAIAVLMIIWGGITLATSGGNEERTAKGKKILTYAIGGIIFIILAQLLIVLFIEMLGGTVN